MVVRIFKIVSFVLAIAAGSTYAFAAQSTVTERAFRYGIPGYDVTGITFDINDTDPTVIDAITFHVAPSSGSAQANHVEIQTKTDGTWTECSLVDDVLPTRVATCTFGSLAADDVTALDIAAK